ncbi:MAG: VTT domain-containing protein [Acetobacteraceae bacterium]
MRRSRRLLLLVLLMAGVAAAVWLWPRLGWDTLAMHQLALQAFVDAHPVAAPLVYVLAYILAAALSVPQGALLTVTGGLLFGAVFGCALTVVGATIGASILVLAARTALGDLLSRRNGRLVEAVRTGLQRDGLSYLLALRLLPVVPFWAVNLAAAVIGMRLTVFVPGTALGIIPATFVFSSIGAGVGEVLAAGRTPDLSVLFRPALILPLLGLALLSLLPVAWRHWRAAHG